MSFQKLFPSIFDLKVNSGPIDFHCMDKTQRHLCFCSVPFVYIDNCSMLMRRQHCTDYPMHKQQMADEKQEHWVRKCVVSSVTFVLCKKNTPWERVVQINGAERQICVQSIVYFQKVLFFSQRWILYSISLMCRLYFCCILNLCFLCIQQQHSKQFSTCPKTPQEFVHCY